MFYIKVGPSLDSNSRPLVSEATALPPEQNMLDRRRCLSHAGNRLMQRVYLPRVELVVSDGAPECRLAIHDGLGVTVCRRLRWRRRRCTVVQKLKQKRHLLFNPHNNKNNNSSNS